MANDMTVGGALKMEDRKMRDYAYQSHDCTRFVGSQCAQNGLHFAVEALSQKTIGEA